MSYLLLAFDINKDERPNLQEDILSLKNDLQLLNT
jgi:hypothetical protein